MMFLQEEKLRVYLFRYQHIEVHTEIVILFSHCFPGVLQETQIKELRLYSTLEDSRMLASMLMTGDVFSIT